MVLTKTTTVQINRRKVNGKYQYFFRTAVPKSFAIDVLGLNIEEKKVQKLKWLLEKNRVIIEKEIK